MFLDGHGSFLDNSVAVVSLWLGAAWVVDFLDKLVVRCQSYQEAISGFSMMDKR